MGTEKTFTDYISGALRKAATELDELQVQANLGKAEAKEKYEEYKDKFNQYLKDARVKVEQGKEVYSDLRQRFDELRVQLELGKAESLDAFQEQKAKILDKIREIEHKIKSNKTLNRYYAVLMIEIEKFKVQLEWLEEKFKEGAQNMSASFQEGKEDFKAFIQKISDKFSDVKDDEKDKGKWDHFQSEIAEAFTHVKKAFKPS